MPPIFTRSKRAARLIPVSLVAAVTIVGCGSSTGAEQRPTIAPATPAVAPALAAAPAGTVIPAAPGEGLAFDPVERRLAALAGSTLTLYAVDQTGPREVGQIPLPGHGNQVVPAVGGGFLVAAGEAVLTVAADAAEITAQSEPAGVAVLTVAPIVDDPTGIVAVAGTADGRILSLDQGGAAVAPPITGLVESSVLLTDVGRVSVIDRRQASLSEVNLADNELGRSLRVGRGVTTATIDSFGRVLAVDAGHNQVLGFTVEPFMARFQFPVPGTPWAIGYDDRAGLMWVSQTESNTVMGYSLGSGMPEAQRSFPTVRQPNALAVDPDTGTIFVQSAVGDGLQVIPAP